MLRKLFMSILIATTFAFPLAQRRPHRLCQGWRQVRRIPIRCSRLRTRATPTHFKRPPNHRPPNHRPAQNNRLGDCGSPGHSGRRRHHGGGHRHGGGGARRSDIRVKRDVALIGHLDDGLGYCFVYNGGDTTLSG